MHRTRAWPIGPWPEEPGTDKVLLAMLLTGVYERGRSVGIAVRRLEFEMDANILAGRGNLGERRRR